MADVDKDVDGQVNGEGRGCSINYYTLPAKVIYFFKTAKLAINEFIILFYIHIGLNPIEAGMINGLQNIGGMIGAPLFGLLADKLKIQKMLVFILGVISLITMSVQPFIAASLGDTNDNICPVNVNKTSRSNSEIHSNNRKHLYLSLLVTSVVASTCDGNVMSSIDAAALQVIRTPSAKSGFGKQLFAGPFGTAFGSVAMGLSIKFYPASSMSCYSGIFVAYLIFSISLLFSCYFLFKRVSYEQEEGKTEEFTKLLCCTLENCDTVFFLLTALVNGTFNALAFTYFFLFLQTLNAPTLLCSLSMTVGCISASTTYVFSTNIIAAVNGTFNAMAISSFIQSIIFVSVAFLENPYYVLFPYVFIGVSYSLFYASAMEHVKDISDPSTITTISGIVNGLYRYLSFLIAGAIGGKLYTAYGGKKLFIGASITAIIWCVVTFVYVLIRKYRTNRT